MPHNPYVNQRNSEFSDTWNKSKIYHTTTVDRDKFVIRRRACTVGRRRHARRPRSNCRSILHTSQKRVHPSPPPPPPAEGFLVRYFSREPSEKKKEEKKKNFSNFFSLALCHAGVYYTAPSRSPFLSGRRETKKKKNRAEKKKNTRR